MCPSDVCWRLAARFFFHSKQDQMLRPSLIFFFPFYFSLHFLWEMADKQASVAQLDSHLTEDQEVDCSASSGLVTFFSGD